MILEDVRILACWMVLVPLWQRYKLTIEKASAQFEAALARKDILLAADGGDQQRACGFAWCVEGGAFARSAYLRLIGVHPECAGRGVGSALLAAAEESALRTGDDLFLLVSDFNRDAQCFYQKHGYRPIGAVPGYVLPDVAELIYWKPLRPRST
jgi:ribosomal protein S18 acetylase RimI-like enzyme